MEMVVTETKEKHQQKQELLRLLGECIIAHLKWQHGIINLLYKEEEEEDQHDNGRGCWGQYKQITCLTHEDEEVKKQKQIILVKIETNEDLH
jgi:hypothetical protein